MCDIAFSSHFSVSVYEDLRTTLVIITHWRSAKPLTGNHRILFWVLYRPLHHTIAMPYTPKRVTTFNLVFVWMRFPALTRVRLILFVFHFPIRYDPGGFYNWDSTEMHVIFFHDFRVSYVCLSIGWLKFGAFQCKLLETVHMMEQLCEDKYCMFILLIESSIQ